MASDLTKYAELKREKMYDAKNGFVKVSKYLRQVKYNMNNYLPYVVEPLLVRSGFFKLYCIIHETNLSE